MGPFAAFTAAGLALAFAGCACVYLASPHQRWLAHVWPAKPARAAGAALLAAGLAACVQAMQAVAAVFAFCTWVMLVFVLLPYLGALLTLARGRA